MTVEIALLQETRATHVALIRLLAVMHVHVLLQRVGQAKTFGADGALKPTFARVHQHMRLDMAGLLKPFTAHLAIVLPLLRMRKYVPFQHALGRKHLLTTVALEQTVDVAHLVCRGVVAAMRVHVLLQRVQRVEFHAAHRALERTIVVVRKRVLAEVAQLLETLVAHVTYVWPLVRMRSHVSLQHAGEAKFLCAVRTL